MIEDKLKVIRVVDKKYYDGGMFEKASKYLQDVTLPIHISSDKIKVQWIEFFKDSDFVACTLSKAMYISENVYVSSQKIPVKFIYTLIDEG